MVRIRPIKSSRGKMPSNVHHLCGISPVNKINLPKFELQKAYKKHGAKKVAEIFGVGKPTVLRNLREYGIPIRKQARPCIKKKRVCAVCEKTFSLAPVYLKKKNGGTYCSKKCLGIGKRGRNSPHWNGGGTRKQKDGYNSPEYLEWRKNVFERDDYICCSCGDAKYIQAHHIKSWSEYPEPRLAIENGITLCKECHAELHHIIGWGGNRGKYQIIKGKGK